MVSEYLLPIIVFVGLIVLIGLISSTEPAATPPPFVAVIPFAEVNVAVMPFEDLARGGLLGRDLRARIEAALTRRPGVNVFSRTNLDIILQEQQFSASGLVDPTTALAIGQLTGVNKIVIGTVLGVHTYTQAGLAGLVAALASVMLKTHIVAQELRARVSVQFQIIDAQTGRVDFAETITEEGYIILQDNASADPSVVVSDVLDKIANVVAERIHSQYTEEIRYGTYKSVKKKGKELEGVEPANVFRVVDGQAILLVYVKRVRPGATLGLEWRGPDGTVLRAPPQEVREGTWLPFSLPLFNCTSGKWTAVAFLRNQPIFSCDIIVY